MHGATLGEAHARATGGLQPARLAAELRIGLREHTASNQSACGDRGRHRAWPSDVAQGHTNRNELAVKKPEGTRRYGKVPRQRRGFPLQVVRIRGGFK